MATDIQVARLVTPVVAETGGFNTALQDAAKEAMAFAKKSAQASSQARDAMGRFVSSGQEVAQQAAKMGGASQQMAQQFSVGAIAMGNIAAQAGIKIVEGLVGAITKVTSSITGFVKSGAFMAGKFQEMEFAAIAVGRQMGVTREEILSGVDALNKAGIRYDVAAQTASQFARAQLDLAQAGELANAAQGAAILLQEDSSATMARLVGAIASGSSMTLKGVGITKTFSEMEKEFATSVGKSVDALSQKETMQARLDGVLKESAALTEVYAAAQESPTKKLRSLTGRVIPELQAALSASLLPAWKTVITVVYDFATALTGMMKEGGALYPFLVNIGAAASLLADVFKGVIGKITDSMKGLSTTATNVGNSFVSNFTGRLTTAAQNALTWGINIATQLATGLIRGASSAITAAMKFIGGMLSSWLAPGSPPKVAKNIVRWGTATFSQYLGGFGEASFAVLNDLQAPLKSVLSTLVDAGKLGAEASSGLFKDLTQDMTAAIATYQKTGKVSEGLFAKLETAGGEFGADLANLAKKQFALAKATMAVERAEKDLEAARQKQTAAQDDLSTKMTEYNELLASGADPSVLAAKREEFEAAKDRAKLAGKEAKEAEARKKAATGQVKPLQKQVSTQKQLLTQLTQFADMQKEAASSAAAVGGAMGDVAKAAGGLGGGGAALAGLGEGLGAGLGEGLGDAIPNALSAAIDTAKEMLRSKATELFAPIVTAWEDLKAGPLADLVTAWEELREPLGIFLNKAREVFTDNLEPILAGVAAVVVTLLIPSLATLATVTIPAAVSAGIALVVALAPIVLAVAAIGIAVGLLVAAWQNDWGGIRTTLTEVWEGKLQPIFATIKAWLAEKIPLAIEVLRGFWEDTLLPAITRVWTFLRDDLLPLFQALDNVLSAVLGLALEILAGIWENVLLPVIKAVWTFLRDDLLPVFQALDILIREQVVGAIEWLTDKIKPLSDTFGGVSEKIQDLTGWLGGFADKIRGIELPDWLQSHSPPPLARGVEFIDEQFSKLAKNKAWRMIGASLTSAWKGQIEPAFTAIQTWLTVTLPEAIEVLCVSWRDTLLATLEIVRGFIQDQLVPSFESLAQTMSGSLITAIKTLSTALIGKDGLVEALSILLPTLDVLVKYLNETFNPAVKIAESVLGNWELGFYDIADAVDLLAWRLRVLKTIIDNLPNLPDDWEIGSPTPAEMAFRGVSAAVRELATVELPRLSQATINLPAMGGGYTGASTEYNFAMAINANEVSPESVVQGYETMRALVGA